MARSTRYHNVMQNCVAKNEKFEKSLSSRRLRVAVRSLLSVLDEEVLIMPVAREVFDMDYRGGKDGKSHFDPTLTNRNGRPYMTK